MLIGKPEPNPNRLAPIVIGVPRDWVEEIRELLAERQAADDPREAN